MAYEDLAPLVSLCERPEGVILPVLDMQVDIMVHLMLSAVVELGMSDVVKAALSTGATFIAAQLFSDTDDSDAVHSAKLGRVESVISDIIFARITRRRDDFYGNQGGRWN